MSSAANELERRARRRGPRFAGARPATGVLAVALIALVALGCAKESATTRAAEPTGAVFVEELARGSPLAAAGLAAGDRLLAWRRGEEGASFDSWDDLARLEIEQAPLGPITVEAERAGRRFAVELAEDRWRARARPALDAAAAATLARALAAITTGSPRTAYEELASLRPRLGERAERAWLELRLAGLPADARGEADDPWAQALRAAAASGDPELEGWVAAERCFVAAREAKFAAARAACERALSLRGGPEPTLAALHVRYLTADLAGREGEPKVEESGHREVLAELDRIAPESLFAARVWRGLAKSRATQDDLAGAFDYAGRALSIVERRAPRSLDHQAVLMTLGIFHWFRAEWPEAEARLSETLAILEEIDPEHEDLANVSSNLGLVAAERGDLAAAERAYLRSLELRSRQLRDPLQESRIYNNLATLAARRGDLATAIDYDRRVLEVRERIAPASIDLATPLLNLGDHTRRAGRLDEAVGYLERALEIQRRHAPESRDVAATLVALGETRADLGDERADATLAAALTLATRVAPGSAVEAEALRALGDLRAAGGELAASEPLLERACEIFARLTPGTVEEAMALHALGRARRRAGRPTEALAALGAAAAALDRQLTTLGGTDEVRALFRASWRQVYRDLADLLLELGRPEEAFEALERSRSRAFLYLLRARQLDVAAGLPDELATERAALAAAEQELDRRSEAAPESREREDADLRARRRELQQRRDRLAERIGHWSPRLAGLSAALAPREAQAALGDAVTAVSYSVDERTTRAWIVGPGGPLEVIDLGVGEAELRELVDRFRLLLEARRPARDLLTASGRLHQLLIAPIAERVRTPGLLLVPDGPLHHLPFAGLAAAGAGGETRYLVEWKPVQVAGSLTSWAELRRHAAGPADGMVAFGDPTPLPSARDAGAAGSGWRRLPHARREAERVAVLFGGAGRARVGGAATEGEAKRTGEGVRYLHFATHAYVDSASPLDSALVLAPGSGARGGREDGLLHGWEVLQEVRLDAALVVLSGCETGGGALVSDEGILGLTRVFHFAGARAVLASLWPVSDRATSRLMERFYRELTAGRAADEALRRAQLELLASPDGAHPSQWAAFQLHGAVDPGLDAGSGAMARARLGP